MNTRTRDAEDTSPGLALLFVCFFASGALGLVYEVIWLRMLGLIFGHTVYAITTVLAAFMAGLALGSFVFGRRAPRIRNLIRTYGWLEICIGAYCLLIPTLLGGASSIYLALHPALGLSYDAFSVVQFLLIFVLLLVPTTLMGGTLPVLGQALARREIDAGRMIGALYAVNTFGAVVGVGLAGYVLLPALGNLATTTVAVIGNLAVGVVATVYGRRGLGGPEVRHGAADRSTFTSTARVSRANTSAAGAWLTVAALGVSGAISMIYEVAWTRALTLVIGSSTYAFTAMLVAFLAGIAGGSALYSWLWGSRQSTPATFAALQMGIGLSATATLLLFERMPELFLVALRWSDSPTFVQVVQLVVSASSLLLPTLFIGATFPCALAVAARSAPHIGEDVGRVYAVNTLGAIAGTVLAGFALIPVGGVHVSIKLGIAFNLLLAAALLAVPPRRAVIWRWGSLAATLAAAGVLLLPQWDQRVMSSGPAVYAQRYLEKAGNADLAHVLRSSGEVLFFRDGISGTVTVLRNGAHLFLRVNGKTDASNGIDMATQLMSGHLPLLLHSNPQSVLVIGLGSGITAGAVARHPIEHLDIVEIEPAVVEAAKFFAWEHGDVLKNSKVRTVIADGRNFLLTTANRYDVIISEPSNPWIGGLASLFSVEFFQLARQRLRPGGIMLQWVQGYSLLPDDLRMVVKTFRTAFPATSIWNTVRGDFLLLGRTDPAPFDLDLVESRFPRIQPDVLALGIRAWPGILGYFALGEEDTRRFSEGATLNTDDRLPLEFSAPRALYVDTVTRNQQILRGFKASELPDVAPAGRQRLERPDVRYWIGAAYRTRDMLEDALPHFQRALQLDPEHTGSMLGAGWVHLGLRRPAETLDLAQMVIDREPVNADAFFLAGLASKALNKGPEAATFFQRAVTLKPENAQFRKELDYAIQQSASSRPGSSRSPALPAPPAAQP